MKHRFLGLAILGAVSSVALFSCCRAVTCSLSLKSDGSVMVNGQIYPDVVSAHFAHFGKGVQYLKCSLHVDRETSAKQLSKFVELGREYGAELYLSTGKTQVRIGALPPPFLNAETNTVHVVLDYCDGSFIPGFESPPHESGSVEQSRLDIAQSNMPDVRQFDGKTFPALPDGKLLSVWIPAEDNCEKLDRFLELFGEHAATNAISRPMWLFFF